MKHRLMLVLQQGYKSAIPADKTSKWLDLQRCPHDNEKITTRKVLTNKGKDFFLQNCYISPNMHNCMFIILTDFTEVKKRRGRFSPKKTISGWNKRGIAEREINKILQDLKQISIKWKKKFFLTRFDQTAAFLTPGNVIRKYFFYKSEVEVLPCI